MGIIARLVHYFQDEVEYEAQVDEFMLSHRHRFQECKGLLTEQSLESYEVFKAYQALIENLLDGFRAHEGFESGEQLLSALQHELKGRPVSNLRGSYIKALLIEGTYEGFLETMMGYAGTSQTCAGGPAVPPPPLPPPVEAADAEGTAAPTSPSGASPYTGWSSEDSAALAGAGLLPTLPIPGESVWGWYPDDDGGGQWLAATVQSIPEDGSGIVVSWHFDESLSLLPLEHVQHGGT
eukprot:TRINITY_DN50277_c0_g1_i1.p1 TRINITY_DN50277_c0_g1~~TRINITY_DN50277_c0_g1_i1.p1  ORF type:complete len:237 (-),score=53.06 TRINITY_DN50277_c0_g1_i1:7-717(-)